MTLGTNLMMQWWQENCTDPLPKEYRRVEYIQRIDKTQYLDPAVQWGTNDVTVFHVEVGFPHLGNNVRNIVMGNYNIPNHTSISGYDFNIESHEGEYSCIYGGSTGEAAWHGPQFTQGRNVMDIQQDHKVVTLSMNGGTLTKTYSNNVDMYAIYLLRDGRSSDSPFAADNILWAWSMVKNNVPLRNLIPVVRKADSKPGMYDLCGSICPLTNTPFYINSGTGADFTWGELQ